MRFILDSLKSGWLAAEIEHMGQIVGICASNIMGGDFVGDLLTALYESLTEKASRMVIFSSEREDHGFYIKPESERCFSIGVDFWDWIDYLIPGTGPGEWDENKKASKICGVCRYTIVNDELFKKQFCGISEEQVLLFTQSLLNEFARFKDGNGKQYYESEWLYNSDALCDKGIDDFPYAEYDRLNFLKFQMTKGSDYAPDESHQESWNKTINDWSEEHNKLCQAMNLDERTMEVLSHTEEIVFIDFPPIDISLDDLGSEDDQTK